MLFHARAPDGIVTAMRNTENTEKMVGSLGVVVVAHLRHRRQHC